jgi:hypothetical protein
MKDYLNQLRRKLSLSLVSEYQSLKDVCPQLLRQLQATLGSYGAELLKKVQNIITLRPQLPPKSSGSLHHEESMKSQETMKNVWKLHILDPRVTPHKRTFLEKLKEIFK